MSRRGRGIGEVRALGRVTLQDIARALGVSVSTVSLALRGSDRISAPVRQKVIEEAAAQGYRTDLAGALLRSSKPRIIGLLCDISQELHVEYSRNIITEAEQRGWLVMTEDTAVGGGGAAVARIMQLRAQSLIVVDPATIPPRTLEGAGVPVIEIGQKAVCANADLVVSNNDSGMRELATVLDQEDVLVCLDGGGTVSARHRREALRRALGARGASLRIVPAGPTMDAGWAAMRAVLAEGGFSGGAVVCYNDQCALGAMSALWRAGLRIPQDVRLVGFDNSRIARSRAFEMTSIDRNPRAVARLAVDRAISRAEGTDEPPVRIEVDTRLVRRLTA